MLAVVVVLPSLLLHPRPQTVLLSGEEKEEEAFIRVYFALPQKKKGPRTRKKVSVDYLVTLERRRRVVNLGKEQKAIDFLFSVRPKKRLIMVTSENSKVPTYITIFVAVSSSVPDVRSLFQSFFPTY